MGLRKIFLKHSILHILLRHAIQICDENNISDRTKMVKEATIKLLSTVCTVKTNRFYIPGETNIVEKLRKESYDKGVFAALTLIY